MEFYGLVRDKNGVPVFDNPETAPERMKAMLTPEDIAKLDSDTLQKLGLNKEKA